MEPENNQDNQENNKNSPPADKASLHGIRTFKTDASEYMRKGEVSATDLFIKKQKPISYNIEEKPQIISEKSKKPLYVALGILATVALGFSAYLLFANGGESTPGSKEKDLVAPKPLLVSEGQIILNSEGRVKFEEEISHILKKQNAPGDLIYLPVKKQVDTAVRFLSAKEFLNSLEVSAPAFLTNFLEDNFFLGFLNLQKKHVVLIFEVEKNQYDNTFAGMIRWEKNMARDLNFIALEENANETGAIVFKDKIIKNQNARVAETKKGEILIYTFINRNFIIITDSQEALEEIIRRFVLYKFS